MKFLKLATISLFAVSAGALPAYAQAAPETPAPDASAPADAQAPATPDASTEPAAPEGASDVNLTAGTKVYDSAGAEVGTIESVASGAVVVDTGNSKATLAENSFAPGPKGPVIGMTKQQLDEAVAQATAGGQ